ncbi:MAG: DUF2799 domain-containing protein, partial [Parvularculaceae bacterium]|nr:DUF2799 domain-containing protein [Parvularculaceae bacterium]
MSKEECRLADWQAIGYEDGARGAPVSAISARREICAKKANVAPDMDAYLVGRAQGLEIFCRPSNGFELGARGGAVERLVARRALLQIGEHGEHVAHGVVRAAEVARLVGERAQVVLVGPAVALGDAVAAHLA